ncbi:protein-methionine-sulfoxide reductase catalytic subunit MsrP [Rhodospirillum sp. A1_3_36]|uniref:protein-methionine-sulfoxide reductase catalytic subunit MsrP n=1 Tax=Rhodospirillum sp. A1_3_36 TaxID=3391666 RepID=UPI0039A588A6
MLIKIRTPRHPRENEVTPKELYLSRRRFLAGSAGLALGTTLGARLGLTPGVARAAAMANPLAGAIAQAPKGGPAISEPVTSKGDATSYNNFYEFGSGKGDPEERSGDFHPLPWTLTIDGEVEKPLTLGFEDLVPADALEERIYRLRCVEAWSMVIPWTGFSLSRLIERAKPLSSAKYVAFETVVRPEEMPGQRTGLLDWPYREGLRMDEAMHPLTLMAVGMYGDPLPNQNGAPIRLVVPWKYGFKSIKSVVRISLVKEEPPTTWNMTNAREYGFYSNVNPQVDHPRWSQAKERRIGDFLRRDTLMFNGYEEEVAGLYTGMDLRKFY